MIKIFNSVLIILLIATFVACEDTLDVKPTSIIGSSSFLLNEDDAIVATNGMYARLRGLVNRKMYIWGERRAGSLYLGTNDDSGILTGMYYDNSLNSVNSGPDWKNLYTSVHDANLLISRVPDIEFLVEADKNRILAEAYATRALLYFVMLKTWGGVPIVDQPTEGFKPGEQFMPRNTEAEVLALVKSDVDMSLSLFPDDNLSSARNTWSKPAVLVLKGDVNLWSGKVMGGGNADLTTALSALNEAVGADLNLLPNFDNIFRYGNKGNKEIIMSIHYEKDESSQNVFNLFWGLPDAGGVTQYVDENGTLLQDTELPPLGGLNRGAPSEYYKALFSKDDSRRDASYRDIYRVDVDPADTVLFKKVVTKFRCQDFGAGSREFYDDMIVYRYGGVLLLIAEAKNALGQDPSTEINMVRLRAYGANYPGHEFVNGTQQENDDAIIMERLLEVAYEGKIWWDLIRFDKVFEIPPALQGRESETYLLKWPISQTTLSQNANLVPNPGY